VPAAWREHCIAQILSQQNRRTATGLPFRKAHVRELRAYHSIPGCQPPPENVTHGCQEAAVVSIAQAARQLGVSSATIYRWLRDGFIAGEQLTPGAPWQIRVDQQLRDMVRPQAPDGWLPLSQAATRPGVEFPRPGVTGRHCAASWLRSRRSDLTSSRSAGTCRKTNHRNQVTAGHLDGR
jgi:excisionase family DNA binding protein